MHIPTEEHLARILSGEVPDVIETLSGAELSSFLDRGICPRDGRSLQDRDNPRHPGLNRERFCSCGFAGTT